MGWIGCIRCEKFQCDFVAWTFAVIAQPILHRVSCSNEMVPNAPKHYETQQNMSLGSNGVHLVRLLQKFRYDFMALTFALIAPVQSVLFRVYCRNETIPNAPKHYEMRQNMSLGSYGLVWVRSLRKILTRVCGTNFCINAPVQHILHWVSISNEMDPNSPKHYETQQNMSLGSNGVDRVYSLRKITTRLRGMNFCISCTSSARFAPS